MTDTASERFYLDGPSLIPTYQPDVAPSERSYDSLRAARSAAYAITERFPDRGTVRCLVEIRRVSNLSLVERLWFLDGAVTVTEAP